eukprot:jgi/Botrbrau1/17649/Bobra.0166s0077.1
MVLFGMISSPLTSSFRMAAEVTAVPPASTSTVPSDSQRDGPGRESPSTRLTW